MDGESSDTSSTGGYFSDQDDDTDTKQCFGDIHDDDPMIDNSIEGEENNENETGAGNGVIADDDCQMETKGPGWNSDDGTSDDDVSDDGLNDNDEDDDNLVMTSNNFKVRKNFFLIFISICFMNA